jgi:Lar family restriction alleviation protein
MTMDHEIDDSDRLKPCPFCGGAAEIDQVRSESGDDPNEGGYFIACLACDASTGLRFACGEDPRPMLMEQWNRRAVQEHGRQEVWPLKA